MSNLSYRLKCLASHGVFVIMLPPEKRNKKLFPGMFSGVSSRLILRLLLRSCRQPLMAVITEIHSDKEEKPSTSSSSEEWKHSLSPPHPPPDSSPNPFIFWFYFTLCISLITAIVAAVYSLLPQDEKSWFLSLPDDLRLHYSNGKTIKVQINPGRSPIEIFAIETGPRDGETLVLIHGFGSSSFSFRPLLQALGSNGFRAVAIDLPGSGFSDKSVLEETEATGGVLARFLDVYDEIREKGLFWGFDQLIESGQIPYDKLEMRVSKRKTLKALVCDAAELSRIIQQAIDSMSLTPVHLILHDTGLGPGAIWASENSGSVRSVTIIDSTPSSGALPLWALEIPVIREFVLGVPLVYYELMRRCCSRSIHKPVADAHRALLKGKGGRRAVVGVGKGLNYSFNLGEWGRQEKLREVPIQVIWSGNWSEGWTDEGVRVSSALPQAKFVLHSGGRWPQMDIKDLTIYPNGYVRSCDLWKFLPLGPNVVSSITKLPTYRRLGLSSFLGRVGPMALSSPCSICSVFAEDAVEELAENISKFVSSLPKSVRLSEEEGPLPEHTQNNLDKAINDKDHHHHGHHLHHHGIGGYGSDHEVHVSGYMDPYGLGQGWGR